MILTGRQSFAAEFEPAIVGARRDMRAPVSLDARVGRGGLDRALCRVTDLSIGGARIEVFSPLRKDSMIWLTLPHIGHWAAQVVWSDDYEAGLAFEVPLTEAEFDQLVAD